ncbi:hypothetical protein Fmac_024720 [Flemingia macrophylla]|uniref:Uncharacterized protein n=1 Tax=Flemingia macrophylla TaxID=520843 RepID=A0ABD1LQ65_9FABA
MSIWSMIELPIFTGIQDRGSPSLRQRKFLRRSQNILRSILAASTLQSSKASLLPSSRHLDKLRVEEFLSRLRRDQRKDNSQISKNKKSESQLRSTGGRKKKIGGPHGWSQIPNEAKKGPSGCCSFPMSGPDGAHQIKIARVVSLPPQTRNIQTKGDDRVNDFINLLTLYKAQIRVLFFKRLSGTKSVIVQTGYNDTDMILLVALWKHSYKNTHLPNFAKIIYTRNKTRRMIPSFLSTQNRDTQESHSIPILMWRPNMANLPIHLRAKAPNKRGACDPRA